MNEPLPPMPEHVRRTQLAYFGMIKAVRDIICGTNMTPGMALILAFLGDQRMTRTDIERFGYFVGTSARHCLEALERDHLIKRVEGRSLGHRPYKLTPDGRCMAASIRIRLAMAAPSKVYAAEIAA